MIHDQRLIDAIKSSGIKRIALLDDAFDVPALETGDYAKLYEFLEGADAPALFQNLDLADGLRSAAMVQIQSEEYTGDELTQVIQRLHRQFLNTRDAKFDPSGAFLSRQSNNLADVDPLLTLLRRCKGVEVTLLGANTPLAEVTANIPDLVFADFYLDPEIAANSKPTAEAGAAAASASITRLEEILAPAIAAKKHPSVVLMSSKDVAAQANGYRQKVSGDEGKVFASRFGFIRKSDLQVEALPDGAPAGKPVPIQIARPAADVLLDIIQSHPFGSKLHDALRFWLESSQKAVGVLRNDIDELTLKDFAYLVTHRLSQEGLSLFDYLEWFFGECLLGSISEAAADKIRRPTRQTLDKHADLVEGAYEGRTDKVAQLYNRARVDGSRNVVAEMRMGDLYLQRSQEGTPAMVWAVLTPDCDLVNRSGDAMAAPRLLTVGGRLFPYDGPKWSLADFIILDKVNFSIDWELKNLVTRDTTDDIQFVGSLRPLYAQDLQRRVLTDLSRIGVAVAPVMPMDGRIKLYVLKEKGLEEIALGAEEMCKCEVLPHRGGSDASRIILHRPVAESLITTLLDLDATTLTGEGAKMLKSLRARAAQEKLRKTLCQGAPLDVDLGCKVIVTEKMSASKGWCGIAVEMADASAPAA